MIPYILLTAGLILRSVQVMIKDFKKTDLMFIAGGVLFGLFLVGKLADGYHSGSLVYPWVGLPVGVSVAIAFGFKERILTLVSEGTVLLYGLVGAYIFISHMVSLTDNGSVYNGFILIFISVYISMAAVTAFTSFRSGAVRQVVYMVMYMAMSIGVGVWMVLQSFGDFESTYGLIFIGYSSLMLLANFYYILYFIPYPSKYQTVQDRIRKIKLHAQSLEHKYIDTDLSLIKFIIIALIVASVGILDTYGFVELPVLVAVSLSLGVFLMKPTEKNPFMPHEVYDKL